MDEEQLYLSWVCDFLTVACFAEHYGMTEEEARALIERQRRLAREFPRPGHRRVG